MTRQEEELAAFEAAVKACWTEVPHFTRSSDVDETYEDPKLNTAWWAFAAGIDYAERNGTTPRDCVAVHKTWLDGIHRALKEYMK